VNREGQVWAYVNDPEMIRVLIKEVKKRCDSENENHVAYFMDVGVIDEFDTEALEDDDKWERLA
jgi:sRNA-binding carbon storage regulator CsrA